MSLPQHIIRLVQIALPTATPYYNVTPRPAPRDPFSCRYQTVGRMEDEDQMTLFIRDGTNPGLEWTSFVQKK